MLTAPGWRRYVPYGKTVEELQQTTYSIRYDLSRPELTDDQRRILAWPDQWKEYNLGDYGSAAAAAYDSPEEPTSARL